MDIEHVYGSDFTLTDTNDLAVVQDVDASNERIIRRLLTAVGDYFWEEGYGCGVSAYIGKALTTSIYKELSGVIKSQILQEDSVAKNPTPVITFTNTTEGLQCNISYKSVLNQQLVNLSFQIIQPV